MKYVRHLLPSWFWGEDRSGAGRDEVKARRVSCREHRAIQLKQRHWQWASGRSGPNLKGSTTTAPTEDWWGAFPVPHASAYYYLVSASLWQHAHELPRTRTGVQKRGAKSWRCGGRRVFGRQRRSHGPCFCRRVQVCVQKPEYLWLGTCKIGSDCAVWVKWQRRKGVLKQNDILLLKVKWISNWTSFYFWRLFIKKCI